MSSTLVSPRVSPMPSPLLLPQSPRGAGFHSSSAISQQQPSPSSSSPANISAAMNAAARTAAAVAAAAAAATAATAPTPSAATTPKPVPRRMSSSHEPSHQPDSANNRLLPSNSNISLLSLSFSSTLHDDHPMGSLQEERPLRIKTAGIQTPSISLASSSASSTPTSPKTPYWYKPPHHLTPSSSFTSASQYLNSAQHRRVGHYLSSMAALPGSPTLPAPSSSLSRRGSSANLSALSTASSPSSASLSASYANPQGQAIPQASGATTPACSSRSRRPSHSNYHQSPSPLYFGPATPATGASGSTPSSVASSFMMLPPDSPSLGPISLCSSPSKMFLAQTPPVMLLSGPSSSASSSAYLAPFDSYTQPTAPPVQNNIFDVMYSGAGSLAPPPPPPLPVGPPKQSNISKTFGKAAAAAAAAASSEASSSRPPQAAKVASSPGALARSHDALASGAQLPASVAFSFASSGLVQSEPAAPAKPLLTISSSSSSSSSTCSNTSSKPTMMTNLSRDPPPLRSLKHDDGGEPAPLADLNQTKPPPAPPKNTRLSSESTVPQTLSKEQQDREKVSKTAAAITAALESEIRKQTVPDYLKGKVLGASHSSPINIPSSTESPAVADHSDPSQESSSLANKPVKKILTTDSILGPNAPPPFRAISINADQQKIHPASVSPTSASAQAPVPPISAAAAPPVQANLAYSGSASSLRGMLSPSASGIGLNSAAAAAARRRSKPHLAGLASLSSSYDRRASATNLYQQHEQTIDEDSELVSPTAGAPMASFGTSVGLHPSSVSSLSSLHTLPRTAPDSPELAAMSMTPFDSGLMTPMTLDPLTSRHASLASVDHYFRGPGPVTSVAQAAGASATVSGANGPAPGTSPEELTFEPQRVPAQGAARATMGGVGSLLQRAGVVSTPSPPPAATTIAAGAQATPTSQPVSFTTSSGSGTATPEN